MNISEKIWIVFNPEGRAPKHIHATKRAALTEANRLARANPDEAFYVMESIGAAKYQPVSFYAHSKDDANFSDEIPF